MSIIKNYITWREKALPFAVEKIKKAYMDLLHPNRVPWNENTESLSRFEKGTLGNTLYIFLKNGNIELEPKYESHDIFHIVTGYGLGLNNEARMFFFLFGNGKRTVSIIGSMLVAIVFIPDLWFDFYRQFKRGKEFVSIKNINFENMLHYDFEKVVESLSIK